MKYKKKMLLASFIMFIALLPFSVRAGGISEASPIGYSSTGALSYGWHWLSNANHQAEWKFDPIQLDRATVVVTVCLNCLSTNKSNGGAGYDSKVFVGTKLHGRSISWRRSPVTLHNVCSCSQYPGNSNGIGYQSYGCAKVKISTGEPFSILLKYPGSGNHTAAKRSSVKAIYTY